MKLVLDPEWEVCYIEITRDEQRLLEWPPRASSEDIKRDTDLILRGVPLSSFPWYAEPPGYKELSEKAYLPWEIAHPYARKFDKNRRAEPPAYRLLGIEARVVG